jgi:single-strand DNA-binding protein
MFIGNLGADPEIRSLSNGDRVANLRLAVTERWTKNGEKQERTEWVRVVSFNEHITTVAENYCRKGSKIYVEGQMQTRKYTDSQGVERYQTEVVIGRFNGALTLLDSRNAGSASDEAPARESAPRSASGGARAKTSSIESDDIPFGPCWQ